jgi:hypothetical protein
MGFAGGDDVIVRFLLLQHHPHRFDVVAGKAPIAARVEVAERELVLHAELDAGRAAGDLAGDEVLTAPRRFVVEQDAVGGEQSIGLAIIDGLPVGVDLGAGVGAARMERRGLALRHFGHPPEHLGRARLVVARRAAMALVVIAQRLQQAERAEPNHVGGIFGLIEGDAHVRLRGEVIDLVGAHLLDDRAHPGAVAQVAVVQLQRRRTWAEALAHMVDTSGGEARGAAHHAVHFVALLDEKFREVRAVLPGNPGYQRNFGHQLYSCPVSAA